MRGSGALAAAIATLTSASLARAVEVRVTGTAVIEARAAVRGGRVELRGRLTDDAGRPLAGEAVALELSGPAAGATPRACATGRGPARSGPGWTLVTDASGTLCAELHGAGVGGTARLRFAGTAWTAATALDVVVDTAREAVTLAFEPAPSTLPLERASHVVWIQARGDGVEASDPIQVELSLQEPDGAARSVARASARLGEQVRLVVSGDALGEPGPATLRARFAGTPQLAPAEATALVQRTVRVTITAPASLQPADPADGIELPVAVGWARGPIAGGLVDARLGRESVGTGAVSDGAARVVARFETTRSGDVPLTLTYVPAAPWLVPAEPLVLRVPVSAPSPWRRWPWLLTALGVTAMVTWTWRRPGRHAEAAPARPPADGRASLELLRAGPPRSGWTGCVVDAHEGGPLAGVEIRIVAAGFTEDATLASVTSRADGRFELPWVTPPGATGRMEARSEHHAALVRALPPEGEVVLALVSRRRAILDRLVAWATRAGRPWREGAEPTPGQLARAAEERAAPDIQAWARAAEGAAFGPVAPSEQDERAVEALEPRAAHRG
ncbi:MAG: hypothetical protein IT376_07995 [Polyangiaceae bacterium]|nr:hypothetical protein [Polyangiaceae bacterium]